MIAERLERVVRGDLQFLMILAHPRSGKSELASVRMPAFYLGHHPARQVICASYSSTLADSFGRQVRNLVASPEHSVLFPGMSLAADSKGVGLWHTNHGGVYLSTGVLGSSTGFGAHLLVIDDPIKGREEADSEATSERVYDAVVSSLYTRMMRGGSIVWIYTPWSEDDAGQRFLRVMQQAGVQGEVLRLPARDEDGTPLWPEEFPDERLRAIQATIGAREWNALYMCRPTAEEGDYWQRAWLHDYRELPDKLRIYGASDYATKTDKGDYTVHIVVGVCPVGNMYLLDLWRAQVTSDVWIEQLCDMIARWKPAEWAEESGQILSALGPAIARRMRERRCYVYRRQFASRADKGERAQSMRSRVASRGLYVPKATHWYPDFEHELLAFPGGKNDDMHDALGLIGQLLDHIAPPVRDKSPDIARTIQVNGPSTMTFMDLVRQRERKDKQVSYDGW